MFLLLISNEEKILSNMNMVVSGQVKIENSSSASQKRACLRPNLQKNADSEERSQSENGIRYRTLVDLY